MNNLLGMNRVAQALGLDYDEHEQDWGLLHADPDRIIEYLLAFFSAEPDIEDCWRDQFLYDMAELVYFSVVEKLDNGELPSRANALILQWWKMIRDHHSAELVIAWARYSVKHDRSRGARQVLNLIRNSSRRSI